MLASFNGYPFKVEIYAGEVGGCAKAAEPDAPPGGRGVSAPRCRRSARLPPRDVRQSRYVLRPAGVPRAEGFPRYGHRPRSLPQEVPVSGPEGGREGKARNFLVDRRDATNHYAVHPLAKAQHWLREKKKKVAVDQPLLIQHYNRDMGGVDLVDIALAELRPQIHIHKWYYGPLVINAFGLLSVAAWRLHKQCGGTLHQLAITRKLATSLIEGRGWSRSESDTASSWPRRRAFTPVRLQHAEGVQRLQGPAARQLLPGLPQILISW
jgi:hypothetical protein